jgi:hypothetical protein
VIKCLTRSLGEFTSFPGMHSPNGSLNKYIFLSEVSTLLSYDKMYDIALGVACGIEYLISTSRM